MNFKNFYEFQEYYSIPLAEKKYDEVLNLLHTANKLLPKEAYENNLFDLMVDEARIYTQTNNSDGCFKVIKESLEKGYAFPLYWTRFDFLRSHPEYEPINIKNEILLKQTKENSNFKYEVHLPKAYNPSKKYPLFFCLHGDGGGANIKEMNWYWKSDTFLEKGYIVVYPQSSQVYCYNYFGWLTDPVLSRKELRACYDQLLLDYSIDENCVLIGGFSGGATASIDIAFENTLPVKGVIALCPGAYLDNIQLEDTQKLSERNTKIVIIEGDQDTEPITQHLIKLFEECGLAYKYYINEGIGHSYPKDLAEKTLKAEEFIVGD